MTRLEVGDIVTWHNGLGWLNPVRPWTLKALVDIDGRAYGVVLMAGNLVTVPVSELRRAAADLPVQGEPPK